MTSTGCFVTLPLLPAAAPLALLALACFFGRGIGEVAHNGHLSALLITSLTPWKSPKVAMFHPGT